jgi:hypothetical protein
VSALETSAIVFGLVLGGASLGMLLRVTLPQHHLSDNSKEVVKMGMGFVATMSALVLGLLISSAKSSYDAQSSELNVVSSEIILLDRVLAHYGPEAKEVREMLRSAVANVLEHVAAKGPARLGQRGGPNRAVDSVYDKIQELMPKDDKQRSIQAQALSILTSLQQTRWLMYEQESTAISMPLLVILVFWLTALFMSFGLFAPANGTVFTSLLVSALSVSCAILLILELYTPYEGVIKISTVPLRAALEQLGK